MRNLTQSPEIGLSTDYVDTINAIFTEIAEHDHTDDSYGTTIQSDSIVWSGGLLDLALQNTQSIGLVKTGETPVDNSLYLVGTFDDLYYKKSGEVTPIQITNRPYVNASKIINGIKGDFSTYQLIITFDSPSNSYTFGSTSGLVGLKMSIFKAPFVDALTVTTASLELTNSPEQTNLNGYAYYNDARVFVYSPITTIIRTDKTTVADTLIFDNQIKLNSPPVTVTYPAVSAVTETFSFTMYNPEGTQMYSLPYYNYFGVWFPLASDDSVGGNRKQMFFSEPFRVNNDANCDQIQVFSAINYYKPSRIVYSLNSASNVLSRVQHYSFQIYENMPQIPAYRNTVYYWNDTLIENTVTSTGAVQKYFLADFIARNYNPPTLDPFDIFYKFNFIYDTGTKVV